LRACGFPEDCESYAASRQPVDLSVGPKIIDREVEDVPECLTTRSALAVVSSNATWESERPTSLRLSILCSSQIRCV